MKTQAYWTDTLSLPQPAMAACVTTRGSLTEYLQASGLPFAVKVLAQGPAPAIADEAATLQLNADATVYARHVELTLADQRVVIARSVARLECGVWQPILQRGNRSLGHTLFGGLPGLVREPLQFALLTPAHPLHAMTCRYAGDTTQLLAARRCRFTLADSPLLVCEVFLPTLETLL